MAVFGVNSQNANAQQQGRNRYNNPLPAGSAGPLGMQVPGMGAPSTYSQPLPAGSMGPLGPQGPEAPGPSKSALADAWAAFHPAPPPQQTPVTDYDALFRASMDRQRANIDAQLRSAMADVNLRRAQGQQIVGMLPGEVNKVYDQTSGAYNADLAGANKALAETPGIPVPTGAAQSGVDTIKAAIEGSRANRLADQPYLNIGAADLFNRQAGAVNQAGLAAKSALDEQLVNYYAQKAGQQSSTDNTVRNMLLQSQLKQQAQQQQALGDQGTVPTGSKEWWQAHSYVDPQGTADFTSNFKMDPKTLKLYQDDPKVWKQAQQMLDPALVSFLKFQYGLR